MSIMLYMNDGRLIQIIFSKQLAKKYFFFILKVLTFITLISVALFLCVASISFIVYVLAKYLNSRESIKLLLDFINSLKYPLIIIFFGLFFQKEIRKFLNETEEVSVNKITATRRFSQEQEGDPDNLRAISPEALEPLNDDGDQSHNDTDEVALESLLNSPEAINEYHRIFRMIWGSQFEALKKLSSYREGLTADDLNQYLEMHQNRIEHFAGFQTVNDLMAYPVSESLVKYEPVNKTYNLTYAGLYFLNYLRERNLYDNYLLY